MNKVLVLFSGGMDSFLAACRVITARNKAVLFSCNSGTVANEKMFSQGARRLIDRYGNTQVQWAGVYNTASVINRLNEDWARLSWAELGAMYPNLINAQATCLHCQTSMWIAGLAYCRAKDITAIACGYKLSDVFCTGQKWYRKLIHDICCSNEIKVSFPVWELEWAEGAPSRKSEMSANGFIPKVYEPQCMVGRPVEAMSKESSDSMLAYMKAAHTNNAE